MSRSSTGACRMKYKNESQEWNEGIHLASFTYYRHGFIQRSTFWEAQYCWQWISLESFFLLQNGRKAFRLICTEVIYFTAIRPESSSTLSCTIELVQLNTSGSCWKFVLSRRKKWDIEKFLSTIPCWDIQLQIAANWNAGPSSPDTWWVPFRVPSISFETHTPQLHLLILQK